MTLILSEGLRRAEACTLHLHVQKTHSISLFVLLSLSVLLELIRAGIRGHRQAWGKPKV